MSREMFYQENGKKKDAEVHKSILGKDDGPRINNLSELPKVRETKGSTRDR